MNDAFIEIKKIEEENAEILKIHFDDKTTFTNSDLLWIINGLIEAYIQPFPENKQIEIEDSIYKSIAETRDNRTKLIISKTR